MYRRRRGTEHDTRPNKDDKSSLKDDITTFTGDQRKFFQFVFVLYSYLVGLLDYSCSWRLSCLQKFEYYYSFPKLFPSYLKKSIFCSIMLRSQGQNTKDLD